MLTHPSTHSPKLARRLWLAAALLAALLAACTVAQQTDAPVLVTLPAAAPATASPTPLAPTETATLPPPNLTPVVSTQTPAITPTLPLRGPDSVEFLWQPDAQLKPVGLAATRERVAVLGADGRFAWLAGSDGQLTASAALWPSTSGETQGEVYTDGQLAVTVALRRRVDAESGQVASRSRLVTYDASADELWSLPELRSGHAYTAALHGDLVVVGTWPRGVSRSALAAYDALSGEETWRLNVSGQTLGVRPLLADGARLYALLETSGGRGVACYDVRAGEELWRWLPEGDDASPERLALDAGVLFALGADRLWALDAASGAPRGSRAVEAAPGAGFAARDGLLYFAPAPAAENNFAPGVVAVSVQSGDTVWHELDGEFVDALTLGESALWLLVKDFDGGAVTLIPLDPETGEELARAEASNRPQPEYGLVTVETRVYALGDELLAFGY